MKPHLYISPLELCVEWAETECIFFFLFLV